MNAPERPTDEELLRASAELLDRASRVETGRASALEQRAALVGRVARLEPRRRSRVEWWIPVAAAIVTVAIGLFILRKPSPISFSVDGGPAMTAGFTRASAERESTVSFSDGSAIVLGPGAAGRVNEVSARGARFSVEQGHIGVHVQKRDGGADYVVEAGPYRVRVTGTRFTVDWDPARQHMLVAVTEGSVVVTGPAAEEGITVAVDQAIDLGPRDAAPERVPSPPVDPPASASAPSAAPAGPSSEPPKDEPAARVSWSQRIAKGDFATVLSEADARGIDGTLASAPLDDLMALADAARYGGRSGLATQVLEVVRKRFPGSQPASTAAFLLARAADDAGNAARAISLYDATMSEGGAFAAEALGRKMLLVRRTSGTGAAKAIAKDYLRVYPKGPYAGAARSIVDGD